MNNGIKLKVTSLLKINNLSQLILLQKKSKLNIQDLFIQTKKTFAYFNNIYSKIKTKNNQL